MKDAHNNKSKRRPVNLTIRADVIREAKALGINASRVAEEGLAAAVKRAKEAEWLRDNRAAIEAHNARIERDGGPLIKAYWMTE